MIFMIISCVFQDLREHFKIFQRFSIKTESVSKTRQKKDEFISLLNQALNIDIKSSKEFQLTNTISKNRAKWLLDNIDEFFY